MITINNICEYDFGKYQEDLNMLEVLMNSLLMEPKTKRLVFLS